MVILSRNVVWDDSRIARSIGLVILSGGRKPVVEGSTQYISAVQIFVAKIPRFRYAPLGMTGLGGAGNKKSHLKKVTLSLEQDTGVEPAFTAWEAVVLPIYESCVLGAL